MVYFKQIYQIAYVCGTLTGGALARLIFVADLKMSSSRMGNSCRGQLSIGTGLKYEG